MQTAMSDVDSVGRKVFAHKNDALKEIKATLRAIEEEFNHVSYLLNRERKRKHQALESRKKRSKTDV